jgi:ABC-2 type transport system permease protein
LLANPMSRKRLVVEKLAAMAAGIVGLCAVTGLALLAEGAAAGMDLPVGNVLAAMLHLALLALVFGCLALAVGGVFGHVVMSRAVPALVAVVAYVLNGVGSIVSWLEPARAVSPFYQYIGHDPLRHGLSGAGVVVAVGTAVTLVGVAIVGFQRRDITN